MEAVSAVKDETVLSEATVLHHTVANGGEDRMVCEEECKSVNCGGAKTEMYSEQSDTVATGTPRQEKTLEDVIQITEDPGFLQEYQLEGSLMTYVNAGDTACIPPQILENICTGMPTRFIVAEEGDVDAAKRRWITHLRWRREKQVDQLLRTQYSRFDQARELFRHYFHKRDRVGNLVYIERPGMMNLKSIRKIG
uniref:SEC14 cytosolic factor n=2 Tax=Lygus hesperus TaxID=30085 RepID=A0A146KN31_LYGHE